MVRQEHGRKGIPLVWLDLLYSAGAMTIITFALVWLAKILRLAEAPQQAWLVEVAIRLLIIAGAIGSLAGVALLYRKLLERTRRREAVANRQANQALFDAINADLSRRLKGEKP